MGVKRKLDELGRIVIPVSFRKELELGFNSEIDVEFKDNKVILTNPKLNTVKTKEEIEEKIKEIRNVENYKENLIFQGFVAGLQWVINEETQDII